MSDPTGRSCRVTGRFYAGGVSTASVFRFVSKHAPRTSFFVFGGKEAVSQSGLAAVSRTLQMTGGKTGWK